jgi:hypothetical protein
MDVDGLRRVEPLLIEAELLHAGLCLGLSGDGSLAIEIIIRKIKILVKQNKIIAFYFKLTKLNSNCFA